MTPPELMLSALGCCAMHYAAEYLRARNLCNEAIDVKVSADKTGHPARLAEIRIDVDAPTLTERAHQGLQKAVEACLLHRTLSEPPRVKVRITTSDSEPALAPLVVPRAPLRGC